MLQAKTVANMLLGHAKLSRANGENLPPLTPMGIQKLVYIAHGFCLAHTERPLITEPVYAWRWGPVIKSLYHEFKHFGNREITSPAEVEPEIKSPEEEAIVAAVWDVYKKYNATQLSNMTHQEDTPWSKVTNDGAHVPPELPIGNDVIKEHYKGLVRKEQARS